MIKILLVRHGETEWNRIKRVMGHRHIPLNDTGIKQVTATSDFLKSFSINEIYTSPLKRTCETANIIAASHNIPINHEAGLLEVDFGDWVGKHFDELKDDPDYLIFHKTPTEAKIPNGEKIIDVQIRAVNTVKRIVDSCASNKTVLLTSHCDIIRLILAHYAHTDISNYRIFTIDNASLSILTFNSGKTSIDLLNYPCFHQLVRN